jgi:hypothetical protein
MEIKHLTLAAAALAAGLSLASHAQDAAPQSKRILPQFAFSGTRWCPPGEATTYVLVCDPGSRSPVEQFWNPAGVGVEICRASQPTCTPIAVSPNARPGFEVQDSTFGYSGSLVAVTFGLDRLLGESP